MTGSDLSPELVEAARRRAAELGLDLTLEVADCQNLPYDDASFDVVSSSVGVIFAPDHPRVARSWPGSAARGPRRSDRLAQVERHRRDVRRDGRSCRRRLRASAPPFQWGDEAYVESMLGDAFELTFEELDTPHDGRRRGEMWEVFRDNYGPSFTLWSSLDDERRAHSTRP